MYFPVKRGREGEVHNLANIVNYSMVVSRSQTVSLMNCSPPSRLFECKTCSRQFPSFQALGGHRASHKKPRFVGAGNLAKHIQADDHDQSPNSPARPAKSKTHECAICGIEFAIGQALGGHMRRHRAAVIHNHQYTPFTSLNFQQAVQVPVGKKMMENGTRSVFGLDLNLTPSENDLEFAKNGDQKVAANSMIELCL